MSYKEVMDELNDLSLTQLEELRDEVCIRIETMNVDEVKDEEEDEEDEF
jgi:hypothetical protein